MLWNRGASRPQVREGAAAVVQGVMIIDAAGRRGAVRVGQVEASVEGPVETLRTDLLRLVINEAVRLGEPVSLSLVDSDGTWAFIVQPDGRLDADVPTTSSASDPPAGDQTVAESDDPVLAVVDSEPEPEAELDELPQDDAARPAEQSPAPSGVAVDDSASPAPDPAAGAGDEMPALAAPDAPAVAASEPAAAAPGPVWIVQPARGQRRPTPPERNPSESPLEWAMQDEDADDSAPPSRPAAPAANPRPDRRSRREPRPPAAVRQPPASAAPKASAPSPTAAAPASFPAPALVPTLPPAAIALPPGTLDRPLVVLMANPVPESGKTSVAVVLAQALAAGTGGGDVAVLDLDPSGDLAERLGIDPAAGRLPDVFAALRRGGGSLPWRSLTSVLAWQPQAHLWVVRGLGLPKRSGPAAPVAAADVRGLVGALAAGVRFIVIDAVGDPADPAFREAVRLADLLVVPVRWDHATAEGARGLFESLWADGAAALVGRAMLVGTHSRRRSPDRKDAALFRADFARLGHVLQDVPTDRHLDQSGVVEWARLAPDTRTAALRMAAMVIHQVLTARGPAWASR